MIAKSDTKVVRVPERPGVKWTLPVILPVGDTLVARMYTYEILRWGTPKAGEYFISGSRPVLHKTKNDLSQEYLVAVLVQGYKPTTAYMPAKSKRLYGGRLLGPI